MAETSPFAACFVDTMRPISDAEVAAWRLFLALPQRHWRGARTMFRVVHCSTSPAEAVIGFTANTGVTDAALLALLEKALRDLAKEATP